MQQYVIFNVLKEYCIPKEEEEEDMIFLYIINYISSYLFINKNFFPSN